MGSLRWVVRAPDQVVLCAEYCHPGAEEPTVGTVLDVRGGAISGGPWRVSDWGYGNMLRGEPNWVEVEPAPDGAPPRQWAALEVPDTDY